MLKVYNFMASGVLLTGFVALGLFKFSVVTDQAGNIVVGLTSLGNAIYSSAFNVGYSTCAIGHCFFT